MRLACLFTAVGLACSMCLAQEICGIPKRGPSADALAAFEKIQDAVGIEPGKILLYASSDQLVKDRSGAVSIECPAGGGVERWIVYDPELVKGDALYFALAHETAHHLNSDPISGEPPGKQQELRADYFAAQYLTKPPLNWTSQRLAQALTALPLSKDARGGYPSIEERRAQANAGYGEEYARLHPNPRVARQPTESQPRPGDVKVNPKDGQIYVRIPAGTFTMGCSPLGASAGSLMINPCEDDEKPPHEVTITKVFWLGQTAVTVAAYKKYAAAAGGRMPEEPKFTAGFGHRALNPGWQETQQPITNVSWTQAVGYCDWVGMRLPTEAEWEYAARAGTTGPRYGNLDEISWYADNSGVVQIDSRNIDIQKHQIISVLFANRNGLQRVGLKSPNSFGLYDMLGNVLNWTADWYGDNYYGMSERRDPQGPPASKFRYKTARGGAWDYGPWRISVSKRNTFEPEDSDVDLGFRCAN